MKTRLRAHLKNADCLQAHWHIAAWINVMVSSIFSFVKVIFNRLYIGFPYVVCVCFYKKWKNPSNAFLRARTALIYPRGIRMELGSDRQLTLWVAMLVNKLWDWVLLCRVLDVIFQEPENKVGAKWMGSHPDSLREDGVKASGQRLIFCNGALLPGL